MLGVGGGAGAWLAHAVHVDVGQLDQLADQEVDVDAGTAVDVGRILAGEDADAHEADRRRRRHGADRSLDDLH